MFPYCTLVRGHHSSVFLRRRLLNDSFVSCSFGATTKITPTCEPKHNEQADQREISKQLRDTYEAMLVGGYLQQEYNEDGSPYYPNMEEVR